MKSMFRKLYHLLSFEERKNALILLFMILFMAVFDVIGVASIAPFIAVLTNPEVILTNPILSELHNMLGFEKAEVENLDSDGFLFFLGMVVLVALLFSIFFKALTTYAYEKFAANQNYSLSCQLVSSYLQQPYSWFLDKHSADLGKTVLSEVNAVITGCLLPLLRFTSHLAVSISMITLLIFTDIYIALFTGLGLGGSYILIFLYLRKKLSHIGEDRVAANQERFKIIQEGFGGIKDIKIFGLEGLLIDRFDSPAKRFASHTATQHIAGQMPRFALEAVAFGGMIFLILFLMSQNKNLDETLPLIALFTLAAYRLMPSLQQVYAQLVQIRFSIPALDILYDDFNSIESRHDHTFSLNKAKPLGMKNHLELKNISFQYQNADRKALDSVNIKINVMSKIGIVGSTGSGKSTAIDIILGLLKPSKGSLLVDGKEINNENLLSWQSTIGYVPQQIYLTDNSIAENIAFGLETSKIDYELVERAARIANLNEFVEGLPNSYQTKIGERGVRLSGGQRQRIGIARALYYDPEILVFDEATSSLDNITEQAVMDALHNVGEKKTVIIVAHRITTVKKCDQIFILENGEITGAGGYQELMNSSDVFREMVQVSD